MMTLETLRQRREEILELARRNGAYNVRVFGSTARGDTRDDSDLDFLVEMEEGRSLLDLAGLLIDLEENLDCKVDVLTPNGLSPYIRDDVLREAVPL